MNKEMYSAWLQFILDHVKENNPELLEIVVFDDEVYRPHFEILLEMTIDCLEQEPLEDDEE